MSTPVDPIVDWRYADGRLTYCCPMCASPISHIIPEIFSGVRLPTIACAACGVEQTFSIPGTPGTLAQQRRHPRWWNMLGAVSRAVTRR